MPAYISIYLFKICVTIFFTVLVKGVANVHIVVFYNRHHKIADKLDGPSAGYNMA